MSLESFLVAGKTVYVWPWLSVGNNGIDINYSFSTAIYENERFNEQRRPKRESPLRQFNYNYILQKEEIEKFRNDLLTVYQNYVLVPAQNEPIKGNQTTNIRIDPLKDITQFTDLNYYTNLNNFVAYIMGFDGERAEYREIDFVEPTRIVVTSDWLPIFPNPTYFYQGVICLVESAPNENFSNAFNSEVPITFTEVDLVG